jgi:hypothetical protein
MVPAVVLDEDTRVVAILHQQVQDIVATILSSPRGEILLPIVLHAIVRTYREDVAVLDGHLRDRIKSARA